MDVDVKEDVKVESKELVAGSFSNVDDIPLEPLSKADVNAVSLLNPLVFPPVVSSPAPSDSDSSKPDQKVIIFVLFILLNLFRFYFSFA